MSKVLVTGGSGFVGSHIIIQLHAAGHEVRTTVRSPGREKDVCAMVRQGGVEPGDRLSFFIADLNQDAGWAEAVQGCDYVIHPASPIPLVAPKDENELIHPARDGVIRVLRASRDAGVKRVVFTSTCGAIYYGHELREAPFDETSWTIINDDLTGYVKSKAIAERAAWDFMGHEGGSLELSVVNPVGIFGPVLGPDYSSSIELVKRLMNGMRGAPRLYFGVVDVRDVADLHLRAMTNPAANGQRFIASTGNCMSMLEISKALRSRLGDAAKKAPTRQLPDWIVRLAAKFDSPMRNVLPLLGKARNATGAKAQRVLGWSPRTGEEAVAATGQSLVKLGLLNA